MYLQLEGTCVLPILCIWVVNLIFTDRRVDTQTTTEVSWEQEAKLHRRMDRIYGQTSCKSCRPRSQQHTNWRQEAQLLPWRPLEYEIPLQVQVDTFDRKNRYSHVANDDVNYTVFKFNWVLEFFSLPISAYENAVRDQRLRTEISQTKKENTHYLQSVEKSKEVEAIVTRKRKAGLEKEVGSVIFSTTECEICTPHIVHEEVVQTAESHRWLRQKGTIWISVEGLITYKGAVWIACA